MRVGASSNLKQPIKTQRNQKGKEQKTDQLKLSTTDQAKLFKKKWLNIACK
jgi:hypothetical protein